MTTPHIIQTISEIIIAAALAVGFIYEDKIADFEQRLFDKMRRARK